ncbi:MAG: iron dependent repressor, metal binding and dimerization domain protein [Prolixibacteraceae bacterium]
MNNYNPAIALLIFFGSVIVLFVLFRPQKGWFWLIKSKKKSNEKIVIEDVLKLLYHNQNVNNVFNISDLTRNLEFSDELVVNTIDRMIGHELIVMEGEIVKLTEAGSDYALQIVRAHRLWEKYLAENTGFDKNEWHKKAEHKEHELSSEETNLLASQLGNPLFDPHGDPIPTHTGEMAKVRGESLANLEVNTIGRIIHIEDEPEVIYKQIMAEDIHIGSQIRIVEKTTSRIVFHSEGEAFVLAPVVAGNITISVMEKDVVYDDDVTRLSSLLVNETAKVVAISKEIRGENRRRLLDLGFVKGSKVQIDLINPLGEPKAFLIKGTSIALRDDQASKILILKD